MKEDKKNFRLLWSIAMCLVAALGILKAYSRVGGSDIWWHLKTGELAWRTRSTLPRDVFSFSFAREPWAYKDIVADTLLFLGFNEFSYNWFNALEFLVVAIISLCVFFAIRPTRRSPFSFAFLSGMAIIAVHYHVIPRPLIFTWILFPIFTGLLIATSNTVDAGVHSPRKMIGRFALLTGVTVGWLFLHRAAVLGYALLTGWMLWLGLRYLAGRVPGLSRLPIKPISVWPVLMVVASGGTALVAALFAPFGLKAFTMAFDVITNPKWRDLFTEWQPIGIRGLLTVFPVYTFLIGFVGVGMVRSFLTAWRKERIISTRMIFFGVMLGFFFLALGSVRWLPYSAIFAVLLGSDSTADLLGALWRRLPESPIRLRPISKGLLMLLLCTSISVLYHFNNSFEYGTGESEDLPAGAIAFAKENGLKGPVINAFSLGGYIIFHMWPDVMVLVDGRNDTVYPPEFVYRVLRSERDHQLFRRLPQTREGNWVIATNGIGRTSHPFLFEDPDWSMVYWSETATIHVRKNTHPELADSAFRYIHPSGPDSAVARAMIRFGDDPAITKRIGLEVSRMVGASPRGIRSNSALAVYLHFKGASYHSKRDEIMRNLERRFGKRPELLKLKSNMGME